MKKQYLIVFLFLLVINACKHSNQNVNEQLYEEATSGELVLFRNGDTLLPKGSSPHGLFKLKTNSTMNALLNADGKLISSQAIPDGALIVKDIFVNGQLNLIAVMKKESKSKFAEKGWVWAEYKPDGSVYFDAKKKGSQCVSCHEGSGNHDYTLTFGLH